MTQEEFNQRTADILANLTDQARVSTILTELTTDYETEQADKEKFKTTATKLTADNENLRQANMNLFLKIGDIKPQDTKPTLEDTTPKFDDLFDENGNLK